MGYSAGGHLILGAGFLLRDCGFKINSLVPCYPFLDFTTFDLEIVGEHAEDKKTQDKLLGAGKLINDAFFDGGRVDKAQPLLSPGHATKEELLGLAPIDLVICGHDGFYEPSKIFYENLKNANMPCSFISYEESIHGFLECNYPETSDDNPAKNPKQYEIMREAEAYIRARLFERWKIEE